MNELPVGWTEASLAELGDEVRGSVVPTPGATYALYSVPTFPTHRPEILDGSEIGSSKRPVRPGDVLLCKINPRINRVWIVGDSLGQQREQIASTEYLVLRTGSVDLSRYLMWYLQSPRFREWIELSVEGATGSHTRAKSGPILRQRIPLAPPDEQRRIVKALEEQFSRLEAGEGLLRQARVRLNALRRAVFSRTVAVGDPCTVGDLLERIEAGKSFKCHSRQASIDEWGVIKVSAMTWGTFDELENKAVLSDAVADPRWEIRPGDLLLSRANTTEYVGASVLVDRCRPRLLLSDKSMRLITRPDIVDKAWLRLALSSPESRSQMSAIATGTSDSMRNISQEKVMSIRVRVPPLLEQRRIASEAELQLALSNSIDESLMAVKRRAVTLRRSILERAFRGELLTQDPDDEPASALLEQIAAGRATAEAENGHRPRPRATMERS